MDRAEVKAKKREEKKFEKERDAWITAQDRAERKKF